MSNEKMTLYIFVGIGFIACDWRPLKFDREKNHYRPYKNVSHPDCHFQITKDVGARMKASSINFEIMRALQAVGLHAGQLQDTGHGKRRGRS